MSILTKIKAWTETGDFFAGCLYREDNFPLSLLIKKVLSKVELDDEYIEVLKTLSENGIVVYVLKNKSQLNSLILRELSARKGIPMPVYCHGINMIFWQPFPIAVRVIFSILLQFLFKKTIPDTFKALYLKRIIMEGKSSIIHLGGSEFFENRFTLEAISQLMDAQKTLNVPIYIVPVMVTY
ncbi:MAG: Glycerol-3-phosphate O-acyltransferase, partial [Deltaproteobacteria bacterium]|nr:Glycerol-3-phosphate O-acyltransferase [Deltaproteobacteria bacterium]